MVFIICLIISFVPVHCIIQLLDDEPIIGNGLVSNTLLNNIFNELFIKFIASIVVALVLWAIVAICAYQSENENKYIRKVRSTEQIEIVNGELSFKIESKCVGCGDIRIKYLTNGVIVRKTVSRKNVRFDGENKVVTYKRTRPKGFRRFVLGETTSDLVIVHLSKEMSKLF